MYEQAFSVRVKMVFGAIFVEFGNIIFVWSVFILSGSFVIYQLDISMGSDDGLYKSYD